MVLVPEGTVEMWEQLLADEKGCADVELEVCWSGGEFMVKPPKMRVSFKTRNACKSSSWSLGRWLVVGLLLIELGINN